MTRLIYILLASITCVIGASEKKYVTDELTVPLRSGPSVQHRIIYANLPAGTELEIMSINKEAEFTQVKTRRGTEGWIRSEYLKVGPIARDLLSSLETIAEQRGQELISRGLDLEALGAQLAETQRENEKLHSQLNNTQKELNDVKSISAEAIEEHSANIRLNELNGRLRQEVDALLSQYQKTESNQTAYSMLIGGSLLLSGILLGVVIKSRPRRSGWS